MKKLPKITFLKPVLTKLFFLLNRKHKICFLALIVFTVGFSLVETIGISAIMPFISIVSDPSLLESGWYKKAFDITGLQTANSFLIAMGTGIIVFYFFRAVYSCLLTWFTSRFSFGIYKYLSKNVLRTNLSIPYKVYAQKNSAELMQAIINETNDVNNIILNLMYFCSEIFTVLMIYAIIILLNWQMTLVVTVILLFFAIILLYILAKANKAQGRKRFITGRKMSRILKETFGNIKYVKLKGNEKDIVNDYNAVIEINTRTAIINNFLGNIPKSILESVGFSFLIAVIVFIIWAYQDASKVIPVISMYALALYKILPSVHRILTQLNAIIYREKSLNAVYENLNQPIENEGSSAVEFNKSIRIENIYFKYMTGGDVIKNVSLEIKKGEKVAIIGKSGSGKSTLVDIIIGIHKPLSGKLFIDNTEINADNIRSWRKKIGYIPQSIYLFDGTVAENVSFASTHDEEKIIAALKKANIWDFLAAKDGINTIVGDAGIQLSG